MSLTKAEHSELIRLISKQTKDSRNSYINRRIRELRTKQYG